MRVGSLPKSDGSIFAHRKYSSNNELNIAENEESAYA